MRQYIIFCLFIVATATTLWSDPNDVGKLPKLLGATNEGTEFYLTFHPGWETAGTGNELIKIYISSRFATKVHITAPQYDVEQTTIPNGVIQFTLSDKQALAYTKPGDAAVPPQPTKVWENIAIHVTSDEPIICYGLLREKYTSDGYLAIPTTAWGKSYKVASYADPTSAQGQFLPSYSSIIAGYDNTKVKFILGGNPTSIIKMSDNSEVHGGDSVNVTMNKGDVFLVAGTDAYGDLSGSYVQSDKPVGVVSGNFCANVPQEVGACDYIIEMEQPIYTWGEKYYVPYIKGRLKNPILKIFGIDETTTLYYGDQMFGTITSGLYRSDGWIERRSNQGTPRPGVFSADKPINVVLYNPGQQDDNVVSDPFQMNILPVEQYQDEVIFNTPGIKGGKGFEVNYISMIYQATDDWNIPDDLMFGQANDKDEIVWKKFNEIDGSSGDQIEIDGSGKHWMQKTYTLPGDGVYALKANSKFCVYSYGFSPYDSYGFPAAGLMLDHSIDDSLPPDIVYSQDDEGNITGEIMDQGNAPGNKINSETLQSSATLAGLSVIYTVNSQSYNAELAYDQYIPGSDKTGFRVNILDKEKDAQLVIVATDKKGNDTTLTMSYSAPTPMPSLENKLVSFGNIKLNSGIKSENITIKNTSSSQQSYAIDDIVLKNGTTEFTIHASSVIGKELDPMQSTDISVSIDPNTTGTFSDSIGVTSNGTTKYYAAVNASVESAKISVNDQIDFGNITENMASETKNLIIKNSGNVELDITGMELPSSDIFTVEQVSFNESNPLKLLPGAQKELWIKCSPIHSGTFTDSIKVISDGEGSNTVLLKAKGVPSDVIENTEQSGGISIEQNPALIKFRSNVDYYVNQLEIIGLDGRIVSTESPNKNISNITISTSGLSSGVYFIKVKSDQKAFALSFIINQ